jgi:hypothetical protein
MKPLFAFVFLLLISQGCKQKILSGVELENKLIETMQDYLDKEAKPGVIYKVQDVTYYTDKPKKQYNCEFHVNMRKDKIDTAGIMTADIPNDFSKVERHQ